MVTAKSKVRRLTIRAMTLGQRLKQARTLRNVGQEAVAEAAGVSRSRISQIENEGDAEVSAAAALGMAKFLRINPRWLVFGEEPMEGEPTSEPPDLSPMAVIVARRWESLEGVAQQRILELIEYLQLVANPRYWTWSEKQRKSALVREVQKTAKGGI